MLLGCALASSAGGLRSIWVDLLELCPSSGNVLASTRSERGGARLGFRAGVDCEDCFDFEAEFGSLEFCAHTATLPIIKRANNRLRMHLFYVRRGWSGMPPGSVGRSPVRDSGCLPARSSKTRLRRGFRLPGKSLSNQLCLLQIMSCNRRWDRATSLCNGWNECGRGWL